MTAYYNEHDPFAAAWLRELIADGLIAPGEVDERSIEDIRPHELRPFRQCHFFAGVGVWSLAARLVGISDDAPLWTGSCPCQPFSAAGKGGGFDDERHLWPAFHYLIEQSGPAVVAGEQVAGADGDAWLDLVSADMDATGYAFGAAETCAAGFGSPHERSRNYWLAHRVVEGLEGFARYGDDWGQSGWVRAEQAGSATPGGDADRVADDPSRRRGEERQDAGRGDFGDGTEGVTARSSGSGSVGGLADSEDIGHKWARQARGRGRGTRFANHLSTPHLGHNGGPGPVNGFWRSADWLICRDQRWRPVEPGTFPLVDAGTFRNRVGLLRGAGNAVTLGQAAGFLKAMIDSVPELRSLLCRP